MDVGGYNMKKAIPLFFLLIIIFATYWSVFINKSEIEIYNESLNERYEQIDQITGDIKQGWELHCAEKKDGSVNYIVHTVTEGYKKEIYMVTILDENSSVIETAVVKEKETKGRGSLIKEEEFLLQFLGKGREWDETYDTISGATISSEAAFESVVHAIDITADYINRTKEAAQ